MLITPASQLWERRLAVLQGPGLSLTHSPLLLVISAHIAPILESYLLAIRFLFKDQGKVQGTAF